MSTSDTPTKERAQEAASTAADEGKHVAGVAKEEAQNVAGEAVAQARNLVEEAKTQVVDQLGEQSRTQRDRLVGTLQTLSDQLEQMASSESTPSGLATDLVREVADRARGLSSTLDGREPQDLLEDVRRFARRRPGTFLLGALAAGVVAGRMARAAKQGTSDSGSTTAMTRGTMPAVPAAPTMPPPPAPVGESVVAPAHGAPTTAPTTSTDPGSPSGLGTEAAGYGQRGGTDEERPL
jgi:hypothetical protein